MQQTDVGRTEVTSFVADNTTNTSSFVSTTRYGVPAIHENQVRGFGAMSNLSGLILCQSGRQSSAPATAHVEDFHMLSNLTILHKAVLAVLIYQLALNPWVASLRKSRKSATS
jgi:hypothetical protein